MHRKRTVVVTAARVGGNLLLVAVLLLSLGFIVPKLLGYERYVITGGSMTGTFGVGSIVFDRNVPVSALRVGDVITYQPPADSGVATLVSHRIVGIRHNPKSGARVFQTKGDANPSKDPWTFELDHPVQPRVAFAVPYAGWVFIALADRTVRMVVIGVPAALIALWSLLELVRALRGGHTAAEA